jgi:hypothetical protein
MTVLEIHVNGRRRVTAGLQGSGVVTGILSLVRRRKRTGYTEEIAFGVSGLATESTGRKTDLEWLTKSLRPGDEIKIRICTTRAFDAPRKQKKRSPPGGKHP